MSRGGRSVGEFKSIHAPEQEVVYLRERVRSLERALDKEQKATGEVREIIAELTQAVEKAEPRESQYRPGKTSGTPVTHVLQLTDLHYGEVTQKDEVDGFGEFNPAVAERRLNRLGEVILKKTLTQRAGYNVPHLHILGTADYISGDIHRELSVTNAFPCPVQAVGIGYILGGLVAGLAPHFETVTCDMLTLDNHGRITVKYQHAEGGLNNWSYVVAEVMKQHLARLPNVKVNVHAKPAALVPIGSERYLLIHGHQIKGWAGVPYYGFDRRVAMESVKRMGIEEQEFTKMVVGHFHLSVDAPLWLIGGSLSGTNAFDHSSGRHALPHQTSWFVHPKHGHFDWTRWFLSRA